MVLASGTGVRIAYIKEVTHGTTPASPALQILRATGRAINLEKDMLESDEVRSSRQISDLRHGMNKVTGSMGYELSRIAFDDMIEGAFSGTWAAVNITDSGTTTLTIAGTAATITRSDGSWITDGFRPGDIIVGTGWVASTGANNAEHRILTVDSATVITVEDTGSTLVDEGPLGMTANSVDYSLKGKRIDIGSTLNTYTFVRSHTDVVEHQVFTGVAIDTMTLSASPESMVTGDFGLVGMAGAAMTATDPPISGATYVAAPTHSPFASFDGALYEGGATIAVATSLDFNLANGRNLQGVIGSKFSPDVFEGRARIDGTLTVFLEDNTLWNKFFNETESSLWMKLLDTDATNWMNVVLPRIKYTGGSIDPPQEGPVPVSMPFTALEDTTYAITASIQRSADS